MPCKKTSQCSNDFLWGGNANLSVMIHFFLTSLRQENIEDESDTLERTCTLRSAALMVHGSW